MQSPEPLVGLGEEWHRQPLIEMITEHRLQQEWQKVLAEAD